MKRYYQVLLAVVAVISVISLLFYRHEYNKLRYVLEVFDYFGKPGAKPVSCTSANETIVVREERRFNEPPTSWQRLRDDLYVYSAYAVNSKDVHLVALGETNKEFRLACNLFFDEENEPLPSTSPSPFIRAGATETNDHARSPYVGYRFTCSYESKRVPVAVQLIADVNEAPLEDVVLSIRLDTASSRNDSGVICVSPPPRKPIFSNQVFTFLTFHHLLGIEHFFIYDFGVSSVISARLERLTPTPVDFRSKYTTLSWNFPFGDVPREIVSDIVKEDCLYRTYGKAQFAITLSWEEFMVPRYHGTIRELVMDLSKTKLQADRYKLQSRSFCTNLQRDEQATDNATLTIFKNTRYDPGVKESRSLYIERPDRMLQTKSIITRGIRLDLICVNRYTVCNDTALPRRTENSDPSISRFADRMHDLRLFYTSAETSADHANE